MRKYLFVILAVMLVLATAGYLRADPIYTRDLGTTIQSEVFTASGPTTKGQYSSTIVAGNYIIGYTVYDSSVGIVGLYDTTSTTTIAAGTGIFAEAGVAAGDTSTVNFPFPKKLATGFGVLSTNATCRTTVYFL